MISIYGIVDRSLNTKDKILKEDREFLRMENAMNRLVQDLSSLYNPLYVFQEHTKKKEGDNVFDDFFSTDSSTNSSEEEQRKKNLILDPLLDRFVPNKRFVAITKNAQIVPALESNTPDSLVFMSFSYKRKVAQEKASQFCWIRFFVQEKEGTKSLMKQMIADNIYVQDLNWDNIKAHRLLKGVDSLEFLFWDKKREKFVAFSELEDKKIIHAIQVSLVVLDEYNQKVAHKRIVTPLWEKYIEPPKSSSTTPPQKTNPTGN